jgi:hypothetical protein
VPCKEKELETMSDEFSGPHLQAAVLCERILQEKDDVLTIIRVVDRFVRPTPGPDVPPQAQLIQVMLVVSIKPGGIGTGKYKVQLRMYKPNAQTHSGQIENDVFFPGGQDQGVNIVNPMLFVADEEGLYWIDVLFEGRVLTRVPFRVLFATVPAIQQIRPPIGG